MKRSINLVNLKINKDTIKRISNLKLSTKNLYSIGDWCELSNNFYKGKKRIKSFNFYNWDNLRKKTQDTKVILETYEFFISFLSKRLNKFHNKNYEERFWEIILSRWLMGYIVNLYSRWEIVRKIKLNYKINNLITNTTKDNDFVPENTQHSHWMMQTPENDIWNTWIFNKILQFQHKNRIKKKYIKKIKLNKTIFRDQKFFFKSNVIYLNKRKKIFFYNLALDKKFKFLLMKQNMFLNIFLKKEKVNLNDKIDFNKRDILLKNKETLKNQFYKFILSDLRYSIPKIYVENYSSLEKVYENLNWPKKPDYILTSYGQYYDESFKIYCAKNISKSKLYILQHGYGNFFADKDFYAQQLDKKISDKFLTWGENYKDNSVPFIYPFNDFFLNKRKSKTKKILIILYAFNEKPIHPINGFVNGEEKNLITVKSVESLIKNSRHIIKESFSAKLLSHSMVKSVENSINYKFPKMNFVNSKTPFTKIIHNYNLSVHTFLGTPFFEAMHYGFPCILILNKKMHINFDRDFNDILKKLKNNNICFDNPKKAAEFLNLNNKKIDYWWNSLSVKKIRLKFCNIYCRNINTKKNILKRIFD